MTDDEAQDALRRLHAEVDRAAGTVAARHVGRLQCGRGCAACCVDELTVYEVEAERIRRAHGALLDAGAPHAPGACAFLGADNECRIYPDRPYVCRTQGLPLRWLAELGAGGEGSEASLGTETSEGTEAGQGAPVGGRTEGYEAGAIVEQRDICPLNLAGPPLEELPEDACWLLGPVEERLAALQHALDGGAGRRVGLRRLFRRAG